MREVEPQFDAISKCRGRGVIISGVAPPGSGFDFYSRYFCPKDGVNEVIIIVHVDRIIEIMLNNGIYLLSG